MLSDFIALELKVGKKQLECVGKNLVYRVTNQYVMTVLMHFKLWWDKITVQIEFIYLDNDAVLLQRSWICSNYMLWYCLQESYWPLAAELHWSYELMPKSYCPKTADFFSCQSTLQLQRDCCSWHFFPFNFHESTWPVS